MRTRTFVFSIVLLTVVALSAAGVLFAADNMFMKKRTLVSSTVLLAAVALSTTAVFAADMFSGTWKVNIAKSTYSSGGAPPKEQIAKIKATNDGVSVVVDGVNSTGQKTHTEFSVKFDGKDYPYKVTLDGKPDPNAVGETIFGRKIDDYTYELTTKLKGKVLVAGRRVVSKDGKTLTLTLTGTNAQGQPVNNTVFYEKQ
jgi:hypothetical protein